MSPKVTPKRHISIRQPQARSSSPHHGIKLNSWWAYCPQGRPSVVFMIESWSRYGGESGTFNYVPYFQCYPYNLTPSMIESLKELDRTLRRMSIDDFWSHVNSKEIVVFNQAKN